MATIAIHDLNPVGYGLFDDSESYLTDLSSDDLLNISGGKSSKVSSVVSFGSGVVVGVALVTLVVAYTIN